MLQAKYPQLKLLDYEFFLWGVDSLDATFEMENLSIMPTLSLRASKKVSRKSGAVAKRKASSKGPSFGEWARRVAGMVKSGRRDLSTIEGFGD